MMTDGAEVRRIYKWVEPWPTGAFFRSRRLSWLPGQPIQFHPPRPRAVLRDLAEKYGEVLGQRLKNEAGAILAVSQVAKLD